MERPTNEQINAEINRILDLKRSMNFTGYASSVFLVLWPRLIKVSNELHTSLELDWLYNKQTHWCCVGSMVFEDCELSTAICLAFLAHCGPGGIDGYDMHGYIRPDYTKGDE